MKLLPSIILAILLTTSCSTLKEWDITAQEELAIILDVIEYDLLQHSSMEGANDEKTIWVNKSLEVPNMDNNTYSITEKMIKHSIRCDTISMEPTDSICIEKYVEYNFKEQGFDTLWSYQTKREFFKKMTAPSRTVTLKSKFFGKNISCRKNTFKTWAYTMPIVLNNGEYVILSKGYTCGTLCSYSGTMYYKRENNSWVLLDGDMVIS